MTTGRVRKLSCITLPLAKATPPRPLAGHSAIDEVKARF